MKKLSFFLMAMLVSLTSFAAESLQVTLDFSKNNWGLPVASANKTTSTVNYTNGDYTITLAGGGSGNGHYYNNDGYLIFGKSGATLTLPAFDFKTTKIVVVGRTGASTSTLQNIYVGSTAVSTQTKGAAVTNTYAIAEDYQAAGNVYVLKVTSSHNTQIVKMEIYGEEGGEQGEKVDAPTFSVTETNFNKAFDLTISSAEGTTLKYTTDNTDPKTSATAVSVETNTANVSIPAKSTAVKAVAVKGDLVSVTSSIVYAYVNSAETAYTVAEAMEVIDAGLGLDNELYIKGIISKIESFNSQYGSITYWIEDEEGNEFECYSGLGLNKAKFTSKEDVEVGASVVVCGIMKKYNDIYEFNYNNYLVKYVAPVVNYTVTLSDNTGGFEPLTSGAGEYEEGASVTVSAVDSEGWVFVGWMDENGDIVSNDYQYTFVIEGNVALVAIYAQLMALEVNDLEIITEPVVGLTGTAELMPGMTLSFELIVDDSEQGEDGEFYLTEDSKVYLNDETELEFLEGIALIDLMSNTAQAQVLAAMGETLYLFNLDMSAAPAEPVDLVVTDATIYEENGILFLTAPWEGKTIKAELPATEHQGWMMIEIHEGEEFSIAMSQNATIATVDNVLTITGVFTDNWTGDVYNVTISGKLPVVEPEVIEYVLNGGEFPAVVVPTNAELWEAFKPYYNEYYLANGKLTTPRADQLIDKVSTFAATYMQEIMTDAASEYKWLGDYVQSVATAAGVPLSTDMASANEGGWRWAVHAFFNAAAGQYGAAGIDFTEAGKPEVWGAAYEAEYGVVLPTEPVDAPYTLPTPVKEGYTFVGWYDNAEGTGEAYTVIPAGWAGTLYAIWEVEGPGTALENIAVEGKAVKAIINGQLIIIKNGVQYNAQGQVVK